MIENFDLLQFLNKYEVRDRKSNYDSILEFSSSISLLMIENEQYSKSFNALMDEYREVKEYRLFYSMIQMKVFREITGIQWLMALV